MNYEEMSRLLGIKVGMWWDWEQGGTVPKESTREMVARFFGLKVDDIWPGRGLLHICTINGISHAKRRTGKFWCRRPHNETEETLGTWDDVTCKSCRYHKFDKYREEVARKELRDQGVAIFLGLCDAYGTKAATERLKDVAKGWKPIGG